MAAREAAKSAASLDDLRAILDRFEGCALRATAKQLVFADGNAPSRLMFVGEAPGRDEDIEGVPFVGRSTIDANTARYQRSDHQSARTLA
jgi:DNA polymerase